MPFEVICPYCEKPAKWVENKIVYGRNIGNSFMIWYCEKDDAYVGCHKNTMKPLGIMANKELRQWRMRAHARIDPIWRNGLMSRKDVYYLLKCHLGKEIHIGESDIEMCKKIINLKLFL